jgi:hypothetical protein
MERKDHPRISFSSLRKEWFERARRTQFNIDIFSMRQKSQEQITPFLKRQISHPAFAGIASGDNEGSPQPHEFFLELLVDWTKTIEPKLEKIGRLFHSQSESEIGRRSDDADDQLTARLPRTTARRAFFDRSTRCHILNSSNYRERAMVAPL